MRLDAALAVDSLADVPAAAAAAEAIGFDAVWSSETQHDPFLPLALVAVHSTRLKLGTAIAVAFARSPTAVAHAARDLAAASGGRFLLGLGTQVRPHIERRFGMPWPAAPAKVIREYILALRAIWHTWQTGEPLAFRGDTYRLTLMSPFFNPGPIEHPDIPIYLAAVNPGMVRLAGEVADGVHAHPLHSAEYLRQVVRPALRDAAERAGRDPRQISLSVSVFTASDEAEAEFVRSQIAFYASTPSYRLVPEMHGWAERAERLGALARRGRWSEMAEVVDDDMLRTYAVVAAPEDLGAALRQRYAGLADRLTLYLPFRPGDRDRFWQRLVRDLAG